MNKKKIAKAKTKRNATRRKNASKTIVPRASSRFAPAPSVTTPERESFPVVTTGASAGGLKAFEQFFTNTPTSNMVFILFPHLDPTHNSIPADLIKRFTKMTIVQIEDGMKSSLTLFTSYLRTRTCLSCKVRFSSWIPLPRGVCGIPLISFSAPWPRTWNAPSALSSRGPIPKAPSYCGPSKASEVSSWPDYKRETIN